MTGRFDVFESQIFRAYARNCVSNKGGHLIHMLEQGNSTHRHALSSSALDPEMAGWAATLKDDCLNCAPPRPPQENNNPYNSASEEDQDLEAVQDPITGHRIRKDRSTISFYRYAAQADAQAKRQGLFEYVSENNAWRCIINLAGTPVDGLSGAAAPTKALARKEAAFIACRSLQLSGLLDSAFFFRTHARTIELHDNTLDYLDPDSGSIHERPHLPLTPEFWRNSISTSPPHFLYPMVVSALSPVLSANEKAPLCILTRAPLPPIPQFQLSRNGDALTIQLQGNLAISLDAKRLDLIHRFTVRFCRIIMNKPFEVSSSAELGCMFAPLRRTQKPLDVKGYDISEDIDWEMVSAASEKWALPFVDLTRLREEIEDVVIQDRAVEFTNRCEILRIREDMTPLSEVEGQVSTVLARNVALSHRRICFGQGGKTLLAQCYCRRKNFEGLVYPNQPILEVVRMPPPANYVNPPTSSVEVPAKNTQCRYRQFNQRDYN
jgi:endoribonuclease Dicer